MTCLKGVDQLNQFYARFDRDNNTPVTSTLDPEVNIPQPFFIENHEVCNMFKRQNIRKSAGPDGVSTATLKHCANELAPLFTDIFNMSLEQHSVPSCFKKSKIIPIPKKTKVESLNDYRPVALTSVIMKVFERLVLTYLKNCKSLVLDCNQFAFIGIIGALKTLFLILLIQF